MDPAPVPFYVTGGSLPPDTPSYVERRADRELLEALRGSEFCYVLTARQMGKSSLMARTAARLRDEGSRVAVLDLTAIGRNVNPEQWYYSILVRLGEMLALTDELEQFWEDQERLGPMRRLMAALDHVILDRITGSLVIFVDEVDVVRSLPFPADEFFAAIRECHNRRAEDPRFRRLTFCLLGVATPTDLIRDPRMTPFNIGRRIELDDFTEAEARPLASGLTSASRPGHAHRLLKRILYWTGGHPYLTQRLCQSIAAQVLPDRGLTAPVRTVDRACASLFFSDAARDRDDNLIFVRERLLRSDSDYLPEGQTRSSLLDKYGRIWKGEKMRDEVADPLCSILTLSGVTRRVSEFGSGSVLKVRNRIYRRVFDRDWVVAHMPDAELRRQRAAFRRGMWRAGVIAGTMLAVMGGLALTANQQAQSAIRATRRVERVASERDRALTRLRQALVGTSQARDRADREARLARSSEHGAEQQRARAEHAEVAAVGRLRDAYLAQGQAWRWSQRPGQRLGALTALAQAARIRSGLDLRNAAIASMALPVDLRRGEPTLTPRWEYSSFGVSRDFRLSAIGDRYGKIRILRTADGAEVGRLPGSGVSVSEWNLRFSPDGRLLSSAYVDGKQRVWDLARRRTLLELAGLVPTFSPDSRRVAYGSVAGSIVIYDIGAKKEIRRFPAPTGGPLHVQFDAAGGRLAVWSSKVAAVWIYAARTGLLLATLHLPDAALDLAWHPSGRFLATSCGDLNVYGWEVPAGRQLWSTRSSATPTAIVFNHGGDLLAGSGWDNMLHLWDPMTGVELLTAPGAPYTKLAFSPDDRRLGLVNFGGGLGFWSVTPAREMRAIQVEPEFNRGPWGIDVSRDGRCMVTAGGDCARLWEPHSGRLIARLPTGWIDSAVFDPRGKALFIGGVEGLWRWPVLPGEDRTTGGPTFGAPELLLPRSEDMWKTRLSVSSDGNSLALTYPGHVFVFRQGGLGPSTHIAVPHLFGVAISPDGRWLATAIRGREGLHIWNASTGKLVKVLPTQDEPADFRFSPDGRWLAGITSNMCRLWEVSSWRAGRVLLRDESAGGPLAFNSDGTILAVGTARGQVKLVLPSTGRELTTLEPPRPYSARVFSLAFTPDGGHLAAAAQMRLLNLWDLRSIRARLSSMGLDWQLPLFPVPSGAEEPPPAITTWPDAARPVALPAGNLLVNGSFELGTEVGDLKVYAAGEPFIPGWSVSRGTVEVIGSFWRAWDGERSLDMDGSSPGAIRQTFATIPGRRYKVLFDLAANPDGEPVKHLRVSAAGVSREFSADGTGMSRETMGWSRRVWDFTAVAASTTLEFNSLSPFGNAGAALDNVAVYPVGHR